jgi:hypothetical protein
MSINPFSISNMCLIFLSAALLGFFSWCWYYLKKASHRQAFQDFKRPVLKFTVVYAIFLLGLCLLATTGFFTVTAMPPRFLLVFLPMIISVILVCKAKMAKALRFLTFLPPFLLVAIQVYRLFIELIFIQFAQEKIIPVELSIHGRNFDLWIGVLALPAGWLLYRQHSLAKKSAILFNLLGLLSLVNIFTIVVPSMPSPFRVYDMLYLPVYFPGILIIFLVSSAIYLHILSLRQLLWIKLPASQEKQQLAVQ